MWYRWLMAGRVRSRKRCAAVSSRGFVKETPTAGSSITTARSTRSGKMLRAGTITPEMHDAAKDFQAAFIVANLDPLRALPILRVPGTGSRPGSERPPAPRSAPRAQGAGGAGRHLEPGGLVRLARRRPAAERPRVGDAAGLGRTAGAAGAGTGDSSGSARDAGGARRVWRGQAGLLKEAEQVPIITVGARSSCGWRIQSDAHPFDL